MKNKINNIRALFVILTLFFAMNAWGEVKTITGSSITGFGNGTTYTEGTYDAGDGITITSDGAFSTTQFRIGKSKKLTISISSGQITEVQITVSTASYKLNAENLSYSSTVGTYSNTEGVESVTFTNSNANIARITEIKITYSTTEDTRTAVNMSTFTTAGGVTSIIRGNTLATSVTNDQSGWTAAYTYSSDKESVATVDANGVITGVSKGTAKIKASLNVDPDDATYKAGTTTSMSIEITVTNPSHHYTFSANGTTFSEGDVEEGESIAFPTDKPEDIYGKTFVGWTKNTIDGTTDDCPELVTEATMGTSDITYYAVFAFANGGSEDETHILEMPDEAPGWSGYGLHEVTDDQGDTWSGRFNYFINNNDGKYYWSLSSNSDNYYIGSPLFSGNVKSLKIHTKNSASSPRKILLRSTIKTAQPSTSDLGSSYEVSANFEGEVSMPIEQDFNKFYVYVSAGLAFKRFTVVVEGDPITYTDYCTTVTAPKVTPVITLKTYETNKETTITQDYLEITYNVSDDDVPEFVKAASVSSVANFGTPEIGTGVLVNPLAEGISTILVKAKETDIHSSVSTRFYLIVNALENDNDNIIWTKVTDVSQLAENDEIIIVAIDDKKAFCEITTHNISSDKGMGYDVTMSEDGSIVTNAKYATVFQLKKTTDSGENFVLYSEGNGYLRGSDNSDISWYTGDDTPTGYCLWNLTQYTSSDESAKYDVEGTLYFKNANGGTTERGIIYSKFNFPGGAFPDYYIFGNYAIDRNYGTTQNGSNTYGDYTQSYSAVGIYKRTNILKLSAKDTEGYWTTFSNENATFFPSNANVKKASVEEDKLIVTKANEVVENAIDKTIDGYFIPANTGVLVNCSTTSAVYYILGNKEISAIEDNMLYPGKGTLTEAPGEGEYKFYKLAYKNWTGNVETSTGLGFFYGAEGGGAYKAKAGGAYLAVPEAIAAGIKSLVLSGNDETDGITNVNKNSNDGYIYNIAGQRVNNLVRGQMYIMNGKKFIAK